MCIKIKAIGEMGECNRINDAMMLIACITKYIYIYIFIYLYCIPYGTHTHTYFSTIAYDTLQQYCVCINAVTE